MTDSNPCHKTQDYDNVQVGGEQESNPSTTEDDSLWGRGGVNIKPYHVQPGTKFENFGWEQSGARRSSTLDHRIKFSISLNLV